MKAMKLTFVVGIVLVSTSPAFSQFVKAALGFRIGHSPTESGYGKSAYNPHEKKAIGVQVLSGVNNGGWKGPLQAAASGYGGGDSTGRSYGGGPLDAHHGHGAVKHLRILGLNLYFGGRAAANNAVGHGGYSHNKPIVKKPIYAVAHQPSYQPSYQPNYFAALSKPITLGAGVGGQVKPIVANAPNGGKILGGQSGFRGTVGTPGFGLGFNLGYKQGINTKSPLGLVFGLGGQNKGGYYAAHAPTLHKGPIYKGQDQVYIPGSGILKGHGHDLSHSPAVGGQNPFGAYTHENSVYAGLESKQHANTQQIQQAASNNQNQNQAQQQPQQQHQSQQASQNHHQQSAGPAKHHQGLLGPMSYPSYSRNPFIAFLQGRPSILRPTRLQYNFNSPNSPQSHPSNGYRMMHHPPTPAPQQRPQHNALQQNMPQGWSTLFPLGGGGGLHPSATNSFVNPLPANGQPLAKLQASLHPGNQFQQQHAPVSSAQNQFPFRQNAQPQFQGFFQSLPTQGHFNQQQQQLHSQPQNTFQNYFSNGFQQNQASAAPQFSQDFNPFQSPLQQNSLQPFPNFPQANFQQSPQNLQQQTPFFNQIQEQPTHESAPAQSPAQSKQSPSPFPTLSEVPFNPTATPFAPESGYQYSHSTVSEPIKMGAYTMNMDLGTTGSGGEPGQAGSNVPMFGPMGRRIVKKTKKQRSDIIIKKQGTAESEIKSVQQEMLEASASSNTNSITMASSLGETSWTPLVNIDIPKIQKKSLETPVSTSIKVVDKQQPQPHKKINPSPSGPSIIPQQKTNIFPSGPSAISTGPAPALGPQDQKSDRTMILKKRRLSLSSAELLNTPTVIPAMTSSASVPTTTSSAPSSSSSTTTTTTTIVPPSSSSSSSAPSTSSESLSTVTSSESSSSSPVTTTLVSV